MADEEAPPARRAIPFGWCLAGGPHAAKCRREYVPTQGLSAGKVVRCPCPCHDEVDKALEELI